MNKKVLGHVLKEQLQDCGRQYRGKEIVKDINERFNVHMSYKQAWRGKEYALAILAGNPDDAFYKLPQYLHNLEVNNPGTVTSIWTDDSNRFEMFFVALGVTIESFREHMRPIVIIDGAHLKGHFKGTMFLAVGMDGNNQIVPLAFGVGKTETSDCWTWFLSKLNESLGDIPNLVIISDRAASIALAIKKAFPDAQHGICCRHLMMNLKIKGKSIEAIWWSLCKAYTSSEFDQRYDLLCKKRPLLKKQLETIGFEKFSRAHFPRDRYDIMTSNSAESFNSVTRDARKWPMTKLCSFVIEKIQKWFYERRQLEAKNSHVLTEAAVFILTRRIEKCKNWTVRGVNETSFDVDDARIKKTCLVNLAEGTCACRKWQLSGLPCTHVIVVSNFLKQSDCCQWASRWFRKDVHHATYVEPIYAVPRSESEWEIVDGQDPLLSPHMNKRQAGRPKGTKRIPSKGEDVVGTPCTRCFSRGHMRSSCQQPLPSEMASTSKRSTKSSTKSSAKRTKYTTTTSTMAQVEPTHTEATHTEATHTEATQAEATPNYPFDLNDF